MAQEVDETSGFGEIMGFVNLSEKTISVKLVYYGVGMGGKTTSLKVVHGLMCPRDEVKLVSINTEQDSTLLFDFLPIDLGSVEGFKIRVQGFTVPGQDKYVTMRRYVLSGADAVVLVVDTQDGRIEENLQSIEDLKRNLAANGLDWKTIPLVIQYNKRDLDNVIPREKLDELFRFREVPVFETIATAGDGVFDAFIESVGLMVEEKVRSYGLGRGTVEPSEVAVEAQRLLRDLPEQVKDDDGARVGSFGPEGLLNLTVPDAAPASEMPQDAFEHSLEKVELNEDEQAATMAILNETDLDLDPSPSTDQKEGDNADGFELHQVDEGELFLADGAATPVLDAAEAASEAAGDASELLGQAISSNLEMAELYSELAEYKALLEKKNRELVEVIQVITHDLKRPLTVFKTVTGLLQGGHLGDLNDRQGDAVKNASDSVHYMEELLLDILDASRLDYDGIRLEFENTDMTLLIGGIIRRLRFQLQGRDIRIRVEPLPQIVCDESAMTKVFMNLVGNAINYMDPAKEEGRIEIQAVDHGDVWSFIIEDNGLGIPPDSLETIWKKFERGTNTTQVSGTGLGLYIVKQFVLGHGGKIAVESTVGEGTCFTFTLPKEPVLAKHEPAI